MIFQNSTFELLFIEIYKAQLEKQHNVIVGVIYRPPDTDISVFHRFVKQILNQSKSEKKKSSYILGDVNINHLNGDKHQATEEYTDLIYSHSLLPSITKPTRVTTKSATLIDNTFCNSFIDRWDFA